MVQAAPVEHADLIVVADDDEVDASDQRVGGHAVFEGVKAGD